MYPYIVCYCGRSLGDLYDSFALWRAQRYAAAYAELGYEIEPTIIGLCPDLTIDLSDIFTALRIDRQCCRARISSQVEIKNMLTTGMMGPI